MDEHEEQQKILMKAALKEGMREWLDERYSAFAKWTIGGMIGSMAILFFSWLVKIILAVGYAKLSAGKH